MTANLLFAVSALCTWVGIVAGLRSVYLLVKLLTDARTPDRAAGQRALLLAALLAGVLLAAGAVIPKSPSALVAKDAAVTIPLVWFVMPWMAWLGVASVVGIAIRLVQGWLALNQKERMDRLIAAGVWLVVLFVSNWLYRRDPDNQITILTGGIPFSLGTAAALGFFAIAAVVAMGIAERETRTRGLAKGLAAQVCLLAGSVVFGLPFAYLVITSFKEDRDMSSVNGIIWVPKVQEKVPYLDPKRPLYSATYRGDPVEGEVIERLPGGQVKIDVFKPLAIRGTTFETTESSLKAVPRMVDVVTVNLRGEKAKGMVVDDLDDGRKVVQVLEPASMKGAEAVFFPANVEPVRHVGLRTENYSEALSFLPPETDGGLVYLKNTLILVVMSVIGTIASSAIVAYAFSRMRFPGREQLFALVLSTMMLPAAVTMLPQFLIFRSLGWIDTLLPLWVPAFFGSAFNIFLLRQFFKQIPMELEDAAKIDGCGYLKTFWAIMVPQIKPALAVIAIWTFQGAWNNFMGPLIYVNSPENMPISYALQLFQGDRVGEPGLLMAVTTLTVIPVLALFVFAQKYFIEGVTLSGLGGR